MNSSRLALLMLALALCANPARASSDEDALVAKGAVLYRANCQACHGAGASHPAAGVKNLHEFVGDEATFAGIVKNGRNAMPAHTYMSADDFAALYAYVKSK